MFLISAPGFEEYGATWITTILLPFHPYLMWKAQKKIKQKNITMRDHTSKVTGRTGGPIRRMQGSKGRGSREYRFTSTLNKEQGNEKERFYAHR